MVQNQDTVGIAGIGCYIPQVTISSEEIAERADIPVDILTEKVGMRRKHIAAPEEQPSSMALAASRMAIERAGVEPGSIDFVIYGSSTPQDYLHWSAAARLQHSLGANKAFSFEIANGCNGLNLGIQTAKDMLLGNPALQCALVASADKYSAFIDYTNKDDVSVFHIADAAAAVILRKNERTNKILTYFQITDGSCSDYVKIKKGGTMFPCSGQNGCEKQTFSVENPQELSEIFARVYTRNYVVSIRKALEQCGRTIEDVDFLFTNQIKASMMASILSSLRIPPSKTFSSIRDYGHMGSVDTLFALSRSLEEKRISPGDLVVLASSAVGFSWAALVLQF